ncbi:hypothetical protein C942_00169 [Photobacterium marinum]|uniref:Uncharacterized protein n=1 Tax=Photobacterium marinum TaxID=1056511 RepID=L8JG71_9GAMM|nr:hypothetical protein C942_00169 [Photobacterium marinum]
MGYLYFMPIFLFNSDHYAFKPRLKMIELAKKITAVIITYF